MKLNKYAIEIPEMFKTMALAEYDDIIEHTARYADEISCLDDMRLICLYKEDIKDRIPPKYLEYIAHFKKVLKDSFFREMQHIIRLVFKPLPGEPLRISNTNSFMTCDEKFLVKKFNAHWYCLPITYISNDGVITTKIPDDLCDENLKGYEDNLACMMSHIIDRINLITD